MNKMKRLIKFALVFVLSITMLAGNLGIIAFADIPTSRALENSHIFQGKVQTEVELDSTFNIPAGTNNSTITVYAPDGKIVTPDEDGKVAATRCGIYRVEVTGDGYAYNYNVHCKESGDYTLKVLNDYDIPSYAATGSNITLPQAKFYNEDDEEVENVNIKIQALDSEGNSQLLDMGATYSCNTPGTVFFTYKIVNDGANKNLYKSYTQVYEVKVQNDFTDETLPTLTVSGVPDKAQVNNKVTLPIATGKDDTDERVKIEVIVTNPEGNQNIYEPNEIDEDTGYARGGFDNNKKVVFDNADNMYFYPATTGAYVVSYQAYDDRGNASTLHKYNITVGNNNAPILVNEDEIDKAIPAVWGRTVKNAVPAQVDSKIHFPMPDFRHQNVDTEISVSFTIKNEDISQMIYFEDINKTETAKSVDGYNATASDLRFTKEGFDFDVSKIKDFKPGVYTATYRSKAGSRTKTKTVEFELRNSYTDKYAPTVEDLNTVNYIILRDGDTFTVPTVVYSDDEDQNAKLTYTISSGETTVDVEGGESYKIVKNDEGYKFVDEDGEDILTLDLDGGLTLKYSVEDSVGNKTEKTPVHIDLYRDDDSNSTESIDEDTLDLDTVDRSNLSDNNISVGGFNFTTENTRLSGYEISVVDPDGNNVMVTASRVENNGSIYVNNISFVSDKEGTYNLFIRLFDVAGNSNLYVYQKEVKGKVPNQSIKPTSVEFTEGSNVMNEEYNLPSDELGVNYYRVITISGRRYSVMGDTFRPLDKGTYKVYNNTIARNTFTEKGYNFTNEDLVEGDLTLYKWGSVNDTALPEFDIDEIVPHIEKSELDPEFNVDDFVFTIDEEDSVTWYKSSGKSEQYTGNGKWFVLPEVTAYTVNGAATRIDVEITANGSGSSDTYNSTSERYGDDQNEIRRVYYVNEGDYYTLNEYDYTEEQAVFANRWAFFADKNAVYTITYKAYAANSTDHNDISQTLVVGDVVSPTINVNLANETGKGFNIKTKDGKNVSNNAFKSGNKFFFDFDKSNISYGEDDTESTVEIKFELLDNEGNVVYRSLDFATEWISLSNLSDRLSRQKDGYELGTGIYTVRVSVRDENGNISAPKTREIRVSATQSSMSVSLKTLTWVLSILAALLIIFVIVYIIRLRKIKK